MHERSDDLRPPREEELPGGDQRGHASMAGEESLQLALKAGRIGTWNWDLCTNLVVMDDLQLELTGLGDRPNPVRATDFFERVHRDDREALDAAVRAVQQGKSTLDHEFRLYVPEKGYRWLAARGIAVRNIDGRPIRMLGVNFDVTDRMTSQEQLRVRTRAIEFAKNGILIADARSPDLPVVYANPAFEELTGYQAQEVIGKNCRFLQGPETDEKTVAQIRNAVVNNEECNVTILNYRRDGTAFWNDLHISPVEDERGQVTHFIGVQTDITERIEYEQRLEAAEAQAKAANHAKSEFLANMSHEIRTPLTAILGCADALYRQLSSEEPRQIVKMIKGQGQLLLGLLNDILDLSKIEAGKLEIHKEPCSVVSIVAEVRSLMQPQALENQVQLNTHYESDLPETINSDPLRVHQILLNLTSNAIKFTSQGSVDISVGCDTSGPDAFLSIAVKDTGVGIPAHRLNAIFDAFTQERVTVSRRVGGTGLGLTICQRLVQMLGGQITVESVEGEGSTFTVRLPIGPSSEVNLCEASDLVNIPTQSESNENLNILIPWRVLVAEDTRSIQFMLKRILDEAVDHVDVVENGEQALSAVINASKDGKPFDLVLMDMHMPVMDGYEATIRLRQRGYERPIIALTAGAMAGDREKCLSVGCNDYLSKPLGRGQLLQMILNHYTKSQL